MRQNLFEDDDGDGDNNYDNSDDDNDNDNADDGDNGDNDDDGDDGDNNDGDTKNKLINILLESLKPFGFHPVPIFLLRLSFSCARTKKTKLARISIKLELKFANMEFQIGQICRKLNISPLTHSVSFHHMSNFS